MNEFLAERGFDMEAPDRFVKIGLGILEMLPHSTRLAATTFMEHFTALLAEQLLNDDGFRQHADPEMIKIWQWHALEELEHKAVAYDVYELVGNTQTERIAAALASMIVLLPMLGITWTWILAKDKQLGNIPDNIAGLLALFGPKGFVSQIVPRLPEFLQKRFHPNDHDTTELESIWRDKLFSEEGQLYAQHNNRIA